MHSSSRTKDSCDDNRANSTNNLAIIGLPLSTLHTSSLLFFRSASSTSKQSTFNLQKIVTESSHTLIRNLHNSIDECLGFLQLFASDLSTEYHKFRQINCRNQRNLNSVSNHSFAAIIPGESMAGLAVTNGVLNFLNIYNTLLVVRLVLTWFPNSPPAIVSPLSTLCDPYLNIFRGVIPPLGGTLDLSPILAFLVLNALTSTASALPAELPSTKGPSSKTSPSIHTTISHFTTSQKKWMKRFHG